MTGKFVYDLPYKGQSWESIETTLNTISKKDLDWRHGRHAAYVWHVDEHIEEIASKAYTKFIATNGLNTMVFPSLAHMEASLVAMTLNKFANIGGAGQLSSGGTESVFLAVYAAREWAKKTKPHIKKPKIVAAFSAHPAVDKAAYYLGLEVVRTEVREDFRADPSAFEQAIDDNTIMFYTSAPAYSIGVIDPIADIAPIAIKNNLWLHVDACVGGMLAPYVREAGYKVLDFDFRIEGVTSISADLHKSGFTAKGASLVLFRNAEYQAYSRYSFENWPSKDYSTLTMTGTRPGGAIAAAYAVTHALGQEGYIKIAKSVMQLKEKFIERILKLDGFYIHGQPDLWAVAYASTKYDVHALMMFQVLEGWILSPVYTPKAVHMMLTPAHINYIDDFFASLNRAIEKMEKGEKVPTLADILRYS